MRNSPGDARFTNKNSSTLDEQIKFPNKNAPQDFFPNEKKTPNKNLDELTIVFQKVEKELSKLDKKVLSESFSKYAKTPEEITHFAQYLISHLRKIDPYEEMLLLYFLQTTICFFAKYTEKKRCYLNILVTAAIFLRPDSSREGVDDPFFDLTIKDELAKDNIDHFDLRLYYERFCENRNEDTPKIILKHMVKIAKKYKPYKPE